MPMIIVGLMVGGIFGLLTAVGAEMVGGGTGLGQSTDVLFFSGAHGQFFWCHDYHLYNRCLPLCAVLFRWQEMGQLGSIVLSEVYSAFLLELIDKEVTINICQRE